MSACGGGGGSSSPPPPPPPPAAITITTASPLPGTLQSQPYTTTLSAANGVGALKWSIAPIDATSSFVDGRTINEDTGVISGTANFFGTAGFTATVTDSNSRSASKSFLLTAALPLHSPTTQNYTIPEFYEILGLAALSYTDGVYPVTYRVTGGSLPPGLRIRS